MACRMRSLDSPRRSTSSCRARVRPAATPLAAGAPSPLCAACRAAIVGPVRSRCARCGAPSPAGARCAACVRSRPRSPARARSARIVAGRPAATSSRARCSTLKYHGDRGLAAPLGELLAVALPVRRRRACRAGPAARVAAPRAWLQPGAAARARASRAGAASPLRPATARAHARDGRARRPRRRRTARERARRVPRPAPGQAARRPDRRPGRRRPHHRRHGRRVRARRCAPPAPARRTSTRSAARA